MADELQFEDNSSPWEMWKQAPDAYVEWAEQKKGSERLIYPRVTGTGLSHVRGDFIPMGGKRATSHQRRIETQEESS